MIMDDNARRDLMLKNAKSLGNSLGTANALNATKEMVWGPMVPQMQAGI